MHSLPHAVSQALTSICELYVDHEDGAGGEAVATLPCRKGGCPSQPLQKGKYTALPLMPQQVAVMSHKHVRARLWYWHKLERVLARNKAGGLHARMLGPGYTK